MTVKEIYSADCGRSLYDRWRQRVCRNTEWTRFEDFYSFVMNLGFSSYCSLYRPDPKKPWGPNNCKLQETMRALTTSGDVPSHPSYSLEDLERIERWNRTVNNIRQQLGLKPLEVPIYDRLRENGE